MATKAVTISARVPSEDAEFISRLEISGAITPSDKLRALIGEARSRHGCQRDYRTCMKLVQELINPVSSYVREQEHDLEVHSEVVTYLLDWLPEVLAFSMSSVSETSPIEDDELLKRLEEGILDRVFRLIEAIMRMGVTERGPCYSDTAIQKRIGVVLDLIRVIEIVSQEHKKEI